MVEIRHLENRHDVIFFCWGWSDLDKMSQTGAEWHVDCGDMVEIETRCRILIWRTFERIQWHVIPEPRIVGLLQGAATWWIYSHVPRATLQDACSHLAKSMSWSCHIAIRLFYFFYAVWALTSGGLNSYRLRYICFNVVYKTAFYRHSPGGVTILSPEWFNLIFAHVGPKRNSILREL